MFLLQLPIWSYVLVAMAVLAIIIGLTARSRVRQQNLDDARRARVAAGIIRTLGDQGVRRAVGVAVDETAKE